MKIHESYRDSEDELIKEGFYKNKDEIVYVSIIEDVKLDDSQSDIWMILDKEGYGKLLTYESSQKLGGYYSPEWLLDNIKENKNSIKKQGKNLANQLRRLSEQEKFIKRVNKN
ncbi:hypothetical protein M0R19_02045 [Candidatus Pacearchaeota archaeon]|nr:hypothetical protein [Candidatus Pacearchaeota archaeon]